MPIAVIVVAFNRPEYTKPCLDSLYEVDHGAGIWPIIVDNGSKRTTSRLITDWVSSHDSLRPRSVALRPCLLRSEENLGFAGGLNLALDFLIREPRPGLAIEGIVILHNDCVVFPGWLGEMKKVLDEDKDDEVACVVPRTNYANEHTFCIPELREAFEKIKPSNKERLSAEEIKGLIQRIYPEGPRSVQAALAASPLASSYSPEVASFCVLVRTAMFHKYGLFDAGFWPRGYEDKAWFMPLEQDGWTCQVANRAFVHHFGNITSDGPGFNFHDVMRINEEKYKSKREESMTPAFRRGLARSRNANPKQAS